MVTNRLYGLMMTPNMPGFHFCDAWAVRDGVVETPDSGVSTVIYKIFWFAFAAGAMGGLIFPVVAILIYLPFF